MAGGDLAHFCTLLLRYIIFGAAIEMLNPTAQDSGNTRFCSIAILVNTGITVSDLLLDVALTSGRQERAG